MAANQAQMLMLLNQVNNLENQMKMAQGQTMGINPALASNPMMGMNAAPLVQSPVMGINAAPMAQNPMMGVNTNLLAMLGQMQSKGSKGKYGKPGAKQTGKNNFSQTGNANIANLLAALSGNPTGQEERGRCIWVTGLPQSYQDSTKLSNIFGNFGNVRKVVFTDKKPDGALIELDDARGCIKAVVNMRDQKLDGQPIKVSFTKIDNAGMKDDGKSKNFKEAKETWRYTYNKDSKFRRICMSRLRKLSSSVLVSNLPEGKSDQLKKFIIESGYTVKSMEGSQRPVDESKPKSDYTMVKVELASVEEAIAAVANLHNSWPKKFGEMKKDRFENSRGLVFSLAGEKQVKNPKA